MSESYDGEDVFTVAWSDQTAVVRHFANRQTRKVCCKVSVTITEKDRAQAFEFEIRKGSMAALFRAGAVIEKKHGRQG